MAEERAGGDMSHRLTINEIEFLKRALRALEDTGNDEIKTSTGKLPVPILDFFGLSRQRFIDTTNKVRLLREKIEFIVGE